MALFCPRNLFYVCGAEYSQAARSDTHGFDSESGTSRLAVKQVNQVRHLSPIVAAQHRATGQTPPGQNCFDPRIRAVANETMEPTLFSVMPSPVVARSDKRNC